MLSRTTAAFPGSKISAATSARTSRAWSKDCPTRFEEESSQKKIWEERKQTYIVRLNDEPANVRLISAADKLYNARTVLDEYRASGPEVWKRFKRGRDQQIWYFREVLRVFKSAGTNRIVEELERVVDELERISAAEAAAQ